MQVTDAMVAKAWGEFQKAFHEHADTEQGYHEITRRALEAAMAELWRPIEEAPKDGSEFLGFGGGVEGDKGIQTVRWCERVGCWETPTASLEDWDNQAEGYSRPTHFMPLPTPPRGE